MDIKRICPALLAAAAVFGALAAFSSAPLAETAPPDLSQRIDAEIAKVWKRDGIKPAAASDDAEFLRRVYLDTVGEPPTYTETVRFLDSDQPNKRDALIDALIADPRFGRHMANHWSNLLTPRRPDALSANHLFAQWLAHEINTDVGFDSIIRDVITAEGALVDKPAIVPYFAGGEAVPFTDMIGRFSKSLMGVQIQCAECHDHPYDEKITQKSFQGMAAFLTATQAVVDNQVQPARIYVRANTDAPNRVLRAAEMYDKLNKEQQAQVDMYINYVKPVTLDGREIDTRAPAQWRAELARWMGSNEQTRLYVANRLWAIAFGSGLVNPVDDFHALNEASHPELLQLLANELKNHFSIKRLYRAILKSSTWQLSGKQPPAKAERWHFASYPARPLSAEQFIASLLGLMLDSQVNALVKQSRDDGLVAAIARLKELKEAGGGNVTYDVPTMNRYAEQFKRMDGRWYIARWAAGRYASLSQDDEMSDGESFSMSITQALAVMNGQFTNELAGNGPDSLLQRITRDFETYDARVDALYLHVLARRPTDAERKRLEALFKNSASPTAAAEDLLFALLMTTEFATNH